MNKKIVMSAMSIMSSLVIVGGATYAQFAASANQTNNTFAVGNAELLIAPDGGIGLPADGAFGPSIAGANFQEIFPGFNDRLLFWLKNTSDSEIELDLKANLLDLDPNVSNIDDALFIKWVCDLDGNGGLDPLTESSAEFTARQLMDGNVPSIGSLEQNESMICGMYARIPTTATNDIADETISFDIRYDGNQVIPEP